MNPTRHACECHTGECPDARARRHAAAELRRMLGTGILNIPDILALLERTGS